MKVIISGGGTGGHIFPAIAIANALREIEQGVEILFVGAQDKMEMEKVPAAGYKIEGLWISGLQRRLTVKNLLFPLKVILSLMKAKSLIKKFNPDVAIGTGGFASGPLLRAACSLGIPALIQEQNSFPGITNKILAKQVNKVCVAYQGMETYFPKEKIVITGNPVRQDIKDLEGKRLEAFNFFGLNPNNKTVLAVGGSLGARTINESMQNCIDKLLLNNIQVIWQTGKNFTLSMEKKQGCWRDVFITRMDLAYAAADIVVSRAGAISLSELAIIRKPAILIPSPNVAEDHQTKNAMVLVSKNAAIIIKDSEAKEKLGKEIITLISDEKKKSELKENIAKFAFPDAAHVIASEAIKLILN